MDLPDTTNEASIPKNPLDMVIGQDEAVAIARVVAKQRRNLLLVGPPGTGKSMIAQSITCLLRSATQEICVLHNPDNPERPILEIREKKHYREYIDKKNEKLLYASEVPKHVAEKLGYRCKSCGGLSRFSAHICPTCGSSKYKKSLSPFDDLVMGFPGEFRKDKVEITKKYQNGREETTVYERADDTKIRCYMQRQSKTIESERRKNRKVIVPLKRNNFIQATGASETELLGDVKHDPYGSAESLGMPAHMRVVPGAIHEAHEGILYLDEIASLGPYQKHLLTAMQDKKYSISGHNPQSSGAAVRVDDVPCDFLLFASCNPEDLSQILPALRSRIRGYGYEVMLSSYTPKTPENIDRMVRFIAQTVQEDGRIPHLTAESVQSVLKVSEDMAYRLDGQREALTLRLRELGGLIRVAGDFAVRDQAELIMPVHVREAEAVLAGVDTGNTQTARLGNPNPPASEYTSYFF